jgi:site-specific DNA-methyltransferase (adenine-specific)
MKYQILHGDNRETLKTIADNSIDAIVTDPPYGIDFLGKDWDANTGALETYQECLRVLKPGGHILAFSAARTYHHLAITLEQAGFEIRDQIMWIYSSGFPKSQDVGRSIQRSLGVKETKAQKGYNGFGSENGTAFTQDWDRGPEKNPEVIVTDPEAQAWSGWGTQLKPAHEPIALARKPIKLSIARNCQTHGVGALNIDATRIPATDLKEGTMGKAPPNLLAIGTPSTIETSDEPWIPSDLGRFPSNVLGDIPDYQKYFYCPKVSRRERHIGFDGESILQIGSTHPDDLKKHPLWDPSVGTNSARLKQKIIDANKIKMNWEIVKEMGGYYIETDGTPILKDGDFGNQIVLPGHGHITTNGLKSIYEDWCRANGKTDNHGNNHPTVKPIELMKYLIRLITPPGGTVLDPFNGSGSTGCAAVELGMTYIGCELDEKYVDIASRRIEAWYEHCNPTTYNQLFEQAA